MGYSGLQDWMSSDCAADFVNAIYDNIIEILESELDQIENEHNTDGVINVGLFLETLDSSKPVDFYLEEFIQEKFAPAMDKKITEITNADWGKDQEGKSYHIDACNRMLQHSKNLLDL